MYTSVVLFLGAAVCASVALWLRGRRVRAAFHSLPTFPQLPIVGNLYKFYGGPDVILQRLMEISDICEKTNLPFLIMAGFTSVIVLNDGEDVKEVTNAFVDKPYYYRFSRAWLGDGLLIAPADIWKRSIKHLAGAFNASIVDSYQPVFNSQARVLVHRLKGDVGREPFDLMNKYVAYITLETICQTALGVPHISDSIVTAEYYAAFNRAIELMVDRGLNLPLHPNAVYRLTAAHREMEKCVKILHNVSDTVIKKRLSEEKERKKEKLGDTQKDSAESFKPRIRSYLDILLEMEGSSRMSLEELRSQVDTVILGGQETSASVTVFLILMIGTKTEVQDKMYAELREIFGASQRDVEKDDLSRMTYCEAVIYETLRLYPPAPAIMRLSDRELKLKNVVIPKDTACCINIWGAGRSQRVWGPDALEFRPERWLETDLTREQTTSFLAFSYGRRSCIGRKYGMAITKTLLAHLLREYQFSSEAQKLKLTLPLVLRPKSGHLVTVKLRKRDKVTANSCQNT